MEAALGQPHRCRPGGLPALGQLVRRDGDRLQLHVRRDPLLLCRGPRAGHRRARRRRPGGPVGRTAPNLARRRGRWAGLPRNGLVRLDTARSDAELLSRPRDSRDRAGRARPARACRDLAAPLRRERGRETNRGRRGGGGRLRGVARPSGLRPRHDRHRLRRRRSASGAGHHLRPRRERRRPAGRRQLRRRRWRPDPRLPPDRRRDPPARQRFGPRIRGRLGSLLVPRRQPRLGNLDCRHQLRPGRRQYRARHGAAGHGHGRLHRL